MRTYGDKELLLKLQRVRNRLPELFEDEDAKQLLVRRIKARFMQGVSPNGTPWLNLSKRTIETKRRKKYSRPEQILYATGRLYNAIGEISGSNFGKLAISTGLGFRIGVDDPEAAEYARFHQFGRGRLPMRRFLGLSRTDVISYTNYVSRRLRGIVNS